MDEDCFTPEYTQYRHYRRQMISADGDVGPYIAAREITWEHVEDMRTDYMRHLRVLVTKYNLTPDILPFPGGDEWPLAVLHRVYNNFVRKMRHDLRAHARGLIQAAGLPKKLLVPNDFGLLTIDEVYALHKKHCR